MKPETKVGLLFVFSIALVALFAFMLGFISVGVGSHDLNLMYNFAGGIEVGSPVRVMGIKVGKVKDVEFDPSMKTKDGEEVKLKVTISIDKKAWKSVKTDSEFYVNLAGVIGEKYIEVSPGSSDAESLEPGQFVRGIDPPRIDQLISQGYGLAGKILEMVEKNEGSVTGTIKMMNDLVTNLNRTLVLMDKTTQNVQVARLLKNIEEISTDVRAVSERLRSEDTKKTIDLLHKLVWRLDGLDKDVIREFLQEEGVKARVSF